MYLRCLYIPQVTTPSKFRSFPHGTHLELIAFALCQSLKDFADQHRLLGVGLHPEAFTNLTPIDPLTVRTITGWPRHYIVLPQSMQCTAGGCVHHDQGPVQCRRKASLMSNRMRCDRLPYNCKMMQNAYSKTSVYLRGIELQPVEATVLVHDDRNILIKTLAISNNAVGCATSHNQLSY